MLSGLLLRPSYRVAQAGLEVTVISLFLPPSAWITNIIHHAWCPWFPVLVCTDVPLCCLVRYCSNLAGLQALDYLFPLKKLMFGLRLGFCYPGWSGTHCVAQADFKFMAILCSRILGHRLEITHAWFLSLSLFGGCFSRHCFSVSQ